MSLIDQARALQAEALELLERLELERAFPSFGPPQLIGSARSGLMVLRDLDVMFTAPAATATEVLAGLADIAKRVDLLAADFRDEREDRRPTPKLTDERFYAVLQHGDWKIELTIWLHAIDRPHVADALRLQSATPDEKLAILTLKNTHPGYPEVIGGSDIYPAVLDHGVRSTGELQEYLDGLAPAAVLAGFGLSSEDGWQAQHVRTLNNSVFSVGRSVDEPAWALRRHRADWRDADAIGAELALLEFLDEQLPDPFSVPRPGRSRDGDYLVTLDGSCYSLLGWIPGMPQRPHPDGGLDAESAWLLGRGLGSIHSVTDRWTRQAAPMQWNARTLFTEAHPGLMGADPAALRAILPAADLELFDEVADRTSKVFDRVQDWGLIHADYILGNCHWTTVEGRLCLGILDFDDFGHGPRLFDLGAVLGNLADFPGSWTTLAPAFLAGYRTAHDLPENAEQELPLMMAARHTSHCLWALGHQDLGQEWIITHLHDRMELARLCLAVSFDFR